MESITLDLGALASLSTIVGGLFVIIAWRRQVNLDRNKVAVQNERHMNAQKRLEEIVERHGRELESLRGREKTVQEISDRVTHIDSTIEQRVGDTDRRFDEGRESMASIKADISKLREDMKVVTSGLAELNGKVMTAINGNKRRWGG